MTCWLTLFLRPVVVPVTLTLTVQLAPGARLLPARVILVAPAAAVTVPQVEAVPGGVATTRPLGKELVNDRFSNVVVASGLWSVNVNVPAPSMPSGMVVRLNTLLMVGCMMVPLTTSVALVPVPLLPKFEDTAPIPIELRKVPGVGLVTSTVIVQVAVPLELPVIEPPDNEIP